MTHLFAHFWMCWKWFECWLLLSILEIGFHYPCVCNMYCVLVCSKRCVYRVRGFSAFSEYCVYIASCVPASVIVHVCVCVCARMHVCISTYIYIYIYIYIYMSTKYKCICLYEFLIVLIQFQRGPGPEVLCGVPVYFPPLSTHCREGVYTKVLCGAPGLVSHCSSIFPRSRHRG